MASRTTNANENVVTLDDDDKHPLELDKEFDGATLEISGHDEPEVRSGSTIPNNETPRSSTNAQMSGGLSRDRPGSTIGRTSVRSTSSRTSLRPGVVKSDNIVDTYYCYRERYFDKAVASCKHIIKPELDGEFKFAWLLTEIDHWDFEREKLVFLTLNSMFIIKYNFITEKLMGFRRIMLHIIANINVGDFEYPPMSIMPARQHGGIQIQWGSAANLTFGQKWNPWCSDIPWVTFSHHPIIYNPKETETTFYNVDDFFESLVGAVSKVYAEKRRGESLKVIEGPIPIENYVSLQAMVFNQSSLGYNRDRNGACF